MRSLRPILAAVLWVAAPASAQDYARPGFYLGVGALGGTYLEAEDEIEDALAPFVASVDVETVVGLEAYAGYRLHPNFAIEAEFEWLPDADIDVNDVSLAELDVWTLTANAKLFPLTGRIQPFVLAGAGVIDAELEDTVGLGLREEETGFVARFGGGLDLYATERFLFSLGADYLLPSGDLDGLDHVTFGGDLQFRF